MKYIKLLLLVALISCASFGLKSIFKEKFDIVKNEEVTPCESLYDNICTDETIENINKVRTNINEVHQGITTNAISEAMNYGSLSDEDMVAYFKACKSEINHQEALENLSAKVKSDLSKIKTKDQFLRKLAKNMTESGEFSFFLVNTLQRKNKNEPLVAFLSWIPSFGISDKAVRHGMVYQSGITKGKEIFFKNAGFSDYLKLSQYVKNIEVQLADLSYTGPRLWYNYYRNIPVKPKYLQKKYPNLKLQYVFKKLPSDVMINSMNDEKLFKYYDSLLKTSTLNELKAAYAYFQMRPFLMALDKPYRKVIRKFLTNKYSKNEKEYYLFEDKQKLIGKMCNGFTYALYSERLQYLILDRLSRQIRHRRSRVKHLTEDLIARYITEINKVKWITSKTKKELIHSLETINIIVAHPDDLKEWNKSKFLSMSLTDFSGNMERTRKHSVSSRLAILNDLDLMCSSIPSGAIGPHYNVGCNYIFIPTKYILPPYLSDKDTDAEVLGGIGMIIAHEIGHALSINKGEYRLENMFKSFNKKERVKFAKYFKSFNSQFGDKASVTFSEDLADYFGIHMAYKEFLSKSKKKTIREKVQFFERFAATFCQQNKSYADNYYKYEVHSDHDLRIDNQARQFKDYSAVMKCSKDDNMSLEDDTRINFFR